MNLIVQNPITASGEDQPLPVPRGYVLMISATAAFELRHTAGGPAFPMPPGVPITIGESQQQTVYVRADAGTVISWALH